MSPISERGRRSRSQWQSLIARGERSELSVSEFCRRESISTASFYSWRKRLGGATPGATVAEIGAEDGAFLELGVLGSEAASPARWEIELELGAGMILRLRRR